MNYILFDNLTIKENLLPLTYFRPIAEIRCGILTLKEKWEYFLESKTSYLTDDYLQEKFPVNYTGDNIYINASFLPNRHLVKALDKLRQNEALYYNKSLLAVRAKNLDLKQLTNSSFKHIDHQNSSEQIQFTFDIFQKNPQQIIADFAIVTQGKVSESLDKTNTIIGKNPIFIEAGAKIEASFFNTEDGPIYIGKNATILAGSLIRGPFAMLDDSVVKMGAKIYQGTSLGPNTTVGGELKNVVFFGKSNKGHDGYLGNSVIAEWCNLGADTNNSNLKNNYSFVRLWNYKHKDFLDTGLQFCGLIMGDHSKCGIATMFNTGTVVGVNSNIFGGDFQPKFFPSFKWGGVNNTDYRFEKAVEVAKEVMKRRNIAFNTLEQNLFKSVYELTKITEK